METPWKLQNELLMYLLKPFICIYIFMSRTKVGRTPKFYGFPLIQRHKGSSIIIGNNFENRNWWWCNPIGINHPTIFCTWSKNALIEIGDNVGISGGSIVASTKIEIGDGTIIGANCLIVDTDFHPLKSPNRRYKKGGVKSFPVMIGKNVFIGTGVTILKGVTIPDDTIIPAGVVVRFDRNRGYIYK